METDPGNIRVLLIEDDEDDYQLTLELLGEIPGSRIALDWRSDFDQGLTTMVGCEHDAYLIDYRLGKHNGIELLKGAMVQGCKGPFILLTGQGDRDLAIAALEAGAADYLVKGKFDAEALERAIRYALQQKQYANQLEQKVLDRTAELARINSVLRESELRLRMVADNMSQLAWTCDELGSVNWCNKRLLDYTGLPFEAVEEWNWTKIHHPDHIDRVVESLRSSATSGELWEETFPLRRADGEYRWFLSRAVPIRGENGEIVRWFGTNTDITELRDAERAIRERQMLEGIVKFQEAERHRIARDLHDHLGQQLTGLRLALADIRETAADVPRIREKIVNAEQSAKLLDKEFSFLAFELRASALNDQTLDEALETYVAEWSRNYQIEAEFEVTGRGSDRRPPEDLETNLYRIAQEALTNILKHSKATCVTVVLTMLPDEIRLLVEDNGVGFCPTKRKNGRGPDHGLGLIGMEERVQLIGGRLEIDSKPGAGTSIFATVPLGER
jgi:PAS domain S-box-containing protein